MKYLEYLRYWEQPQYAKFVHYPHAFYFLEQLRRPEFRKAMQNPRLAEAAHGHQFWHWQKSRTEQVEAAAAAAAAAPLAAPPPPARLDDDAFFLAASASSAARRAFFFSSSSALVPSVLPWPLNFCVEFCGCSVRYGGGDGGVSDGNVGSQRWDLRIVISTHLMRGEKSRSGGFGRAPCRRRPRTSSYCPYRGRDEDAGGNPGVPSRRGRRRGWKPGGVPRARTLWRRAVRC